MLTLDKVYKASHLLKSVARYTDMIESNGLTDDCQLLCLQVNKNNKLLNLIIPPKILLSVAISDSLSSFCGLVLTIHTE